MDIQGQGGICAECPGEEQACSRLREAAKAETNHVVIMGGDLGSVVIDQVLLLYPQSQEAYIRSHNTLSVSLHH